MSRREDAARRWLEQDARSIEEQHRRSDKHRGRVRELAEELERRYGDRPIPAQDEAVARHLRYMIEGMPHPELRPMIERFAAEAQAMFRARRTYRAVWGRQD